MNDFIPKKNFISLFPLCGKSCQNYIVYISWFIFVVLFIFQYYSYKLIFSQWDLLLLTGIITFIIEFNFVVKIREYFELTLSRLLIRGAFQIEDREKDNFFYQLEETAQYWARIGGILATVVFSIAFLSLLVDKFSFSLLLLGIIESTGAYIGGSYFGRMASYGQLGWKLEKESIKIKMNPLHVDGVAGLKPIGDFFFHQAMVLVIPAIFLAVWLFLFPLWPRDYSRWEDIYLILLSIAIIIHIIAFIVPVWSFHMIMEREKIKWLKIADRLSDKIGKLESVLESNQSLKREYKRPEELEDMKKLYWSIENMSTWPMSVKIKNKFRLNNLLLFLPLIGDILKRSLDWKHVINIIKGFGS